MNAIGAMEQVRQVQKEKEKIVIGTAMLILLEGRKMVGIECKKGRGITLPGGKVDPGESFREAAIRECSEEAGIVIHPVHAKLVFHGFSTDQSYCYTYSAGMVNPNQLASVLGSDFGSGKVGVFDYTEFLASNYKAYYDALFQTLGIVQ